ncbi:MAG TPA: HAMP domain-containing sensor histidine kinase, partial [Kofleriaceae bacterium]|nr:HAMP domain-containing sensor histidine kinase [Kofleriaceae bacterium]
MATEVVASERHKADVVLNDARNLEDRRNAAASSARAPDDLTDDRAREDAVIEEARTGADSVVRDERERRHLALASLLAFERESTDLKLETEREYADQALASREDLMAMVSHDLRNLLGGVALSAELLKDIAIKDHASTQITKYAESIQRFTARMNRLVGDLMDVASIEAGKLGLVRTRRNVRLLLRDAFEAFQPAATAQGIHLRCESKTDPGIVELDYERILQVLSNLVGNALKFTPRGGEIVISVERGADDVCFSVVDTGTGIPASQFAKIFDRYVQSGDLDRRGLGLGLFIAKS